MVFIEVSGVDMVNLSSRQREDISVSNADPRSRFADDCFVHSLGFSNVEWAARSWVASDVFSSHFKSSNPAQQFVTNEPIDAADVA
jgi:hypothetical protein